MKSNEITEVGATCSGHVSLGSPAGKMRMHQAGRLQGALRPKLAAAMVVAQGWSLPALIVVSILVATAPAAKADFTINGPTNHLGTIPLTGCAKGVKASSTLRPDPVQHLAAAGKKGTLDQAFQKDLATQFPGWTLNFAGAGLSGVLNIKDYLARDLGNCTGGARMDATYAPGKGDPAGLTFIQYFDSTRSGLHIDPFPNDDKDPMYYTAAERLKWGLEFIDNPSCGPNCFPYSITFGTYLMTFNAKTATVYDGWTWGYFLQGNQTPEPRSAVLLVTGLGLLVGAALVRRRTASETA